LPQGLTICLFDYFVGEACGWAARWFLWGGISPHKKLFKKHFQPV